jgi:uncharacterized membrane protein HdeD (DUF308 family)
MLSSLTRNWYLPVLRGALAVVFGVAAFVWPNITFEALVLLFGAYAFVDGIVVLGYGLAAAGNQEQWWPLVLSGILGIAVGALTFAQPSTMALAIVYVIGAWAIVTGLLTIVAAIRLRDYISTEWLMGLTGALSIVFGALVLAQPAAGATALVYLFGFYAVLLGIAQIVFGFRMRSLGETLRPATQQVSSAPVSR